MAETGLAEIIKSQVTAQKWPFNRIIALNNCRVRLESDSAAWLVEADQRLTKRLSFSKVRAEAPNGEIKVELRGGNVTLIDLKKDNVEIKLKQDGVESRNTPSSAQSTGHRTTVTSGSGVYVRCLFANTS